MTGEHYRFVNMWMARTSYIASAFAMVIFVSRIFSEFQSINDIHIDNFYCFLFVFSAHSHFLDPVNIDVVAVFTESDLHFYW